MKLHLHDILYATDFSDSARQALATALDLTRRYDATLHHYHAIVLREDDPHHAGYYLGDQAGAGESLEEAARVSTRAALEELGAQGLTIRTVDERAPAAGPAILSYAKEQDVDLIVMGTHGRRGIQRWLMGSVAEEVVRRASCPVLTVRHLQKARPARVWWNILVPIDLSKNSLQALAYAGALARANQATVQILHVVQPVLLPAYYRLDESTTLSARSRLLQRAEEELEEFVESADTADVLTETRVVYGNPAIAIVEHAAEAESDLIVINTHGRTGLKHLLMGSVAEKVVRRAPCPVLTVKTFGKSLLPAEPGLPGPPQ
ncbi:MAG: universal stress protein [bacterium]